MEEGNYDLLRNPVNFCWAVNCLVEEDSVRIGALYLEPNVPDQFIRLESGSDIFDVVLPAEFLKRSEPLRAWNCVLPLNQ